MAFFVTNDYYVRLNVPEGGSESQLNFTASEGVRASADPQSLPPPARPDRAGLKAETKHFASPNKCVVGWGSMTVPSGGSKSLGDGVVRCGSDEREVVELAVGGGGGAGGGGGGGGKGGGKKA